MKKKIFALLLCFAMLLALAACGSNAGNESNNPSQSDNLESEQPSDPSPSNEVLADKTPAEQIVDNYYAYYYYPSADFLMDYFFHFYDEVPGIGKVYYAGFAMNQIVFSGTYEVVEESHDYACWATRDEQEAAGEGAAAPIGTAPYTVNFYDFDGNLVDSCGFDGQNLYVDMVNISGIGAEHNVFTLDTDPENSVLVNEYNNEQAPALMSLVSPDDETATLALLVNGKYNDMVIYFVNGTYAANSDMTEFTLTPASTADNGATLTKNDDGTYTYVSADGTEVTLVEEGGSVDIAWTYLGDADIPGAGLVEDGMICELYSDNTVALYASAFGTRMDIDVGTYEIDMATYSITIHFNTAGDVTTYTDDTGMHFDYANEMPPEPFAAIELTLDMLAE